jgi:hypothetical protein
MGLILAKKRNDEGRKKIGVTHKPLFGILPNDKNVLFPAGRFYFCQKLQEMLSNPGVRYGLLGGAVVVFYFTLLYVIKPDLFLSPLLQWGSMGFYLLFMWQAGKVDCAANGTARDFREILRTPFVAFLLINLCYWIFYYALHLFDKSLVLTEISMEMNGIKAQIEAGVGDPQQANILRERLSELDKTMLSAPPQPLGPVITRMCIGALGGFGLAAGIAAILRSKD